MTPIYLSHLPWTDTEAYLSHDDRLILVTGATEQHGHHLPLGTDTMIPVTLAERLSAATDVPIAPPLPYGMSEAHMAFPGTITLSEEVLQGLYLDVIKSAYRHGWRRLFLINGHGGNRNALNWAVSLACKIKRDLKVYVSHWWTEEVVREVAQKVYGRNEGHAGLEETAGVLVDYASLVKLHEAIGHPDAPDAIWSSSPDVVRAALPSGAIGENPGAATADFGEQMITLLVADYVELVNGSWT
jgi:creatinine amidohydrolase